MKLNLKFKCIPQENMQVKYIGWNTSSRWFFIILHGHSLCETSCNTGPLYNISSILCNSSTVSTDITNVHVTCQVVILYRVLPVCCT